jgi:signal transduction histidine kinase
MSGNFKIRLLLLMLAIGFAGTALTINYTFKKEEILILEARKVERRLQKKVDLLQNLLGDVSFRDSLKNIQANVSWARYLISEFSEKRNIYINTYEKGQLVFLGGIQASPETDKSFKEGINFIRRENGYFEVVKKTWEDFSVLCFIPIKYDYPYQNEYLRNDFAKDLLPSNSLDIAQLEDKEVYNIRNSDAKYLFSVKLRSNKSPPFYLTIKLVMWCLSIVFFLIFVTSLCLTIADNGHINWAILLLFCVLTGLRLIDLEFRFFSSNFELEIFNPQHFASNYFFPSIGEFLLNILAFTWLLAFIYVHRFKILRPNFSSNKLLNYFIFCFLGVFVCIVGFFTNELFFGLITNSNINFEVGKVLSSDWLNYLALVIFCLAILNLFLLISSAFAISSVLILSIRQRLIIFSIGLSIALVHRLFFTDFTIFFLLFAIVLLLIGISFHQYNGRLTIGTLVICLLIFSLIGSIKLSRFQSLKERDSRKLLANRLESSSDPNAEILFLSLEKNILSDPFIIEYFKSPLSSHYALKTRLMKLYLAGYLSKYDFQVHEFDTSNQPLRGDQDINLANFKNLVLNGSFKVSDYFYQRNNTFGFQQYFALIPIKNENNQVGTIVLELKSKPLAEVGTFPELLVDGKISDDLQLNDYSYAYYKDGRLLNQHGRYIYNLQNYSFLGKTGDYLFENNSENKRDYSHLIYQPNSRRQIIVSKEQSSMLDQLASVSFIFLVFLFFASFLYLMQWLWNGMLHYQLSWRNFKWNYLIKANKMLYKTRIQLSMVLAVVITLLITGMITFYNISGQYRQQQEEFVLDKLNKMSAGVSKQLISKGYISTDENAEIAFNTFADMNAVDLNLFGLDGRLILSTQPKIYENSLIAPRMNSLSYLFLNNLQKSEYINRERIGELSFLAAYVPIKNDRNEEIAYLGLPYFSNEKDYENRIGVFLDALINVYVLVFIAIGFFAVFVANRITSPLTLIQKSLRETKIGRKNEPISWKRNDEIGDLVSEYNNMIVALEDSANKLATSERETAWREMAQQVAHEIKNPLTPLKLGIQLLERSWRERDPNFNEKFERFNKSFIEQIDSLAHIASEFSSFAKMPQAVFERVNLKEIIEQSIILYRQSEHTSIILENMSGIEPIIKADKDQLLRCFNNLIKNSIEARFEKRRSIIRIFIYCREGFVHIEIKDNGIGIPEDLGQKIFTPNFTTKTSGTGLGLAFVKQIIESIGGIIRFKTFPGMGTTFFISVPLDRNSI